MYYCKVGCTGIRLDTCCTREEDMADMGDMEDMTKKWLLVASNLQSCESEQVVFCSACVFALQHSWRPRDKTWVAKTGRLGQRRIHELRVFKSTVGYCMICNALKPGNSCCSSQRSANDILFMIRFVVFTQQSSTPKSVCCLILPNVASLQPCCSLESLATCLTFYIPLSRRRRMTFARN